MKLDKTHIRHFLWTSDKINFHLGHIDWLKYWKNDSLWNKNSFWSIIKFSRPTNEPSTQLFLSLKLKLAFLNEITRLKKTHLKQWEPHSGQLYEYFPCFFSCKSTNFSVKKSLNFVEFRCDLYPCWCFSFIRLTHYFHNWNNFPLFQINEL